MKPGTVECSVIFFFPCGATEPDPSPGLKSAAGALRLKPWRWGINKPQVRAFLNVVRAMWEAGDQLAAHQLHQKASNFLLGRLDPKHIPERQPVSG